MTFLRADWRDAGQVIREERHACLTLNVICYGLVVAGMTCVFALRTVLRHSESDLNDG